MKSISCIIPVVDLERIVQSGVLYHNLRVTVAQESYKLPLQRHTLMETDGKNEELCSYKLTTVILITYILLITKSNYNCLPLSKVSPHLST